jgi:hypothetical protein
MARKAYTTSRDRIPPAALGEIVMRTEEQIEAAAPAAAEMANGGKFSDPLFYKHFKALEVGSERYSLRVNCRRRLFTADAATRTERVDSCHPPSAATREPSTGNGSDVLDRQLADRRALRFVQARALGRWLKRVGRRREPPFVSKQTA